MKLFFDRNFGTRLPKAISHLRPPVDVKWHQGERFKHDMPDDEWLSIVGQRGWTVLSQDIKFHKLPAEIFAIKQHGVRCFYFPCAQQTSWSSMCNFVRSHLKIIEQSSQISGPFIFSVTSRGTLKKINF